MHRFIAAAIVACLALLAFDRMSARAEPVGGRWEYRVVIGEMRQRDGQPAQVLQDLLNEQGQQGWELASSNPLRGSLEIGVGYQFIFRRPR